MPSGFSSLTATDRTIRIGLIARQINRNVPMPGERRFATAAHVLASSRKAMVCKAESTYPIQEPLLTLDFDGCLSKRQLLLVPLQMPLTHVSNSGP